jgi:phosphonoacetate hydrolase
MPIFMRINSVTGKKITEPMTRDSGGGYRGTHGYLPTGDEMRASLIIYGVGARAGSKIRLARMVDVAPTVAALLKLSLPQTEGKQIKELLNPH